MRLSFADILRYSPYDHAYALRALGCTEKFFIDNFRVNTNAFEEELREFRLALTRNTTNHKPFIILSGYSGCGKTTLLHYLASELDHLDGHKFFIVNLTKEVGTGNKGLQLLSSALEDEVFDSLKISVKALKIIEENYPYIKGIRPKDVLPNRNLLVDITRLVDYWTLAAQKPENKEEFLIALREFIGEVPVTELLIYYMLDKVTVFEDYLKTKYKGEDIEQVATESLVICFDNMDELSLQAITVEFWESFNNAKSIVDIISSKANLYMKGEGHRFLTTILTLRESNVALYSSQWNDRFQSNFLKRRVILDGDVSEIMERRAKYIKANNKSFESDTSQLLELIEIFDTDKDWVRSQVLPLFNFDYRKYFESLPSLLKRDTSVLGRIPYELTYKEYLSLNQTNRTIARGALYGYLISYAFITYFDRFICEPEESCNKYRMLLTVMFNLAYPNGLPDNTKERNSKRPQRFTVKELLENTQIFSEEEVLRMTVDFFPTDESSFAQWIMIYDSNLFTLANSNLNYSEVKSKKILQLTEEEKEFQNLIERSYIHFNASAFAYLRFIITHYEYYLYLVRRNTKLRNAPLALLTKIIFVGSKSAGHHDSTNTPYFEFEHHINLVLEYVIRKKKGIEKYYEEVFLLDFPTEREYSDSLNAFGENDPKKSFYLTKLLFTHINYIDNFRYVAWYNDNFKIALESERFRSVGNTIKTQIIPVKSNSQIQDFLINTIEKYIDLCEGLRFKDNRNDLTIKSMKENITQIRKLKNPKNGEYNFPEDTRTNVNDEWIWIRGEKVQYD